MVLLQGFYFERFTFVLEKAIVVADEKAHHSLYCIDGCCDCDGNQSDWAVTAYNGKLLSLEEVGGFLFFSFLSFLILSYFHSDPHIFWR